VLDLDASAVWPVFEPGEILHRDEQDRDRLVFD
jgi:hypothetical protein